MSTEAIQPTVSTAKEIAEKLQTCDYIQTKG